jgi:hypothetical protein
MSTSVVTTRKHLRIYDIRDDVSPTGPVELDVSAAATDEEIIAEIERTWVAPNRPHSIEWHDGFINPGWTLTYHGEHLDEPGRERAG